MQTLSADKMWATLHEISGKAVWPILQLLTRNPDMALPLLRSKLHPLPIPEPNRVTALLAKLDDDNYQIRNQAVEQLANMGEGIEPALRESLANNPSLEVRKLIDEVLLKVLGPTNEQNGMSRSQLRVCRGVEVLERIGTPAAMKLLEELSRLPAGLTQAEEAAAAVQRLKKAASIPVP